MSSAIDQLRLVRVLCNGVREVLVERQRAGFAELRGRAGTAIHNKQLEFGYYTREKNGILVLNMNKVQSSLKLRFHSSSYVITSKTHREHYLIYPTVQ